MNQKPSSHQAVLNLPFGPLGIRMQGGRLLEIDYLDQPSAEHRQEVDGLSQVIGAIEDYIDDPHSGFDLELELAGTPFQQSVWRALSSIPAGQTLTYGELAEKLSTGARAVGNACRANPCPLVVPCHRVVARNGLGGFAGERSGRKLAIKRWLLQHEGRL
jgi:methylated-DNA-[protein]-cysteine S-methyltransferase